jgi:hypothetical protein
MENEKQNMNIIPRKTSEDLAGLLTFDGLRKWEGWNPVIGLTHDKYQFTNDDEPSLGEHVEGIAYALMQTAYSTTALMAGVYTLKVVGEFLQNM